MSIDRFYLLCAWLLVASAAAANAADPPKFLPISRVNVKLEGDCATPPVIRLVLNGNEQFPVKAKATGDVWTFEPAKNKLQLDPNTAFVSVRLDGGRTRCYRRSTRWDPDPADERYSIATFTVPSCATGLHDYGIAATPPFDIYYSRDVKNDRFDKTSVPCTEGAPLSGEIGGTISAYWPKIEKVTLSLFDSAIYPGIPLAAFKDQTRNQSVGRDKIAFLWLTARSGRSGAAPNSLDLDARVLDKRQFKSLTVRQKK